MKRLGLLFGAFCLLLTTVDILAQVPKGIKYQAAARSPQGSALPNQDVGVRFTIIATTPDGVAVYSETHQTTTNGLGLFALTIGMGTAESGKFDAIPWEDDQFFVKVEFDPQGGSAYVDLGTTQLMSVPYSFVSNKSILSEGVDVDTSGVTTGDVLKYDNGTWVAAEDEGAGGGDNDWTVPAVPNPTEMWATGIGQNVLIGQAGGGNGSKLQIRNTDVQPKEVDILSPNGDGIDIGVVGRNGIFIHGPGQDAIHVDGDRVIQRNGLFVTKVKQHGVNVEDVDGTGIITNNTGGPGLIIEDPGMEAIRIEGPVAENGINIKAKGNDKIAGSGVEIAGTRSHGIHINDNNGNVEGDGIRIEGTSADGIKGHGILISQTDVNNTNNGILATIANEDDFEAFAVRGVKGNTARLSTKSAAVSGEASKGPGVLGVSKDGDGVVGHFFGTSNFAAGKTKLRAGIHGFASSTTPTEDNFAIIGSGNSYGSGILGVGDFEQGWGVFGISPQSAGAATNAGIRGVTAEGTWPYWPLKLGSDGKGSVGVFGQGKDFAGVWGESLRHSGVIGSTGRQRGLPQDKAGIQGYSTQEDAYGVFGSADSSSGVKGESSSEEETKAGVWAKGNGVKAPGAPKAAALKIDNGAITVTGANQPAGVITVSPQWIDNRDCVEDGHTHPQGYTSNPIPWQHPLLKANSVIVITPESNQVPVFAQIYSRGNGSAQLHVYTTWCNNPPPTVQIHFIIVNPVAE